ncbi:hypothetical protein MPL3356_270007 [Mesorhizobium plurifarium]|uniref:Uncharacterized protein n=1 Tax=Mesorhizobium plurifarium TaxID=69974 RepID=A0A090FGR7_MESPL|nr:hypothetical protein MPL3356_270007 [Mesorhizobium plurifarium]
MPASAQPAEQLAAALVDMAPPGLDCVFFSDSGSTSVEVALKMALGFHRNNGFPRSRIVVIQLSRRHHRHDERRRARRLQRRLRAAAVRGRHHPLSCRRPGAKDARCLRAAGA